MVERWWPVQSCMGLAVRFLAFPGGAVRKMERLVHYALAALFLLGIASAQNVPAVDVFGGYSYFNFDLPASSQTSSQRLNLQGWNVSLNVGLVHHLSIEGDISGHTLSSCGGTGFDCSNFSYMGGPRFTIGNRSSRITYFVHGLVGRDRADLYDVFGTVSDQSIAFAGGGGIDYWLFRHVGIQAGPFDYVYTRHLNSDNVPTQGSVSAAGGIVFRFGGSFPASEPSPKSKGESSSRRWHRNKPAPAESQPPITVASRQPAQPVQPLGSVTARGMQIPSLGVVLGPQEFDGAKILEIVPGGVAEMASLHVGDLIRSVDGRAVKTPMELLAELSDKSGKVRIGILRGDVATETVIVLGSR